MGQTRVEAGILDSGSKAGVKTMPDPEPEDKELIKWVGVIVRFWRSTRKGSATRVLHVRKSPHKGAVWRTRQLCTAV